MTEWSRFSENWGQQALGGELLAGVFVSPDSAERRYILGRNEDAVALSQQIDVQAFVDDFACGDMTMSGIPIVRGEAVPHDAIIVNCSTSISPVSAHRRAENLNVSGVIALGDLCHYFPDRFSYPGFVVEMRDDFYKHENKWKSLYEVLTDVQSKQVLIDVMNFRLTCNYRHMQFYSVRLEEQYFEDFLGLTKGEIFVDTGGYDGDTTEQFCNRCPDYERIYLIEPSQHNLAHAKKRLSGRRDITYIEKGVSDTSGKLRFNPEAGSASSLSIEGICSIEVAPLDQLIAGKTTFIKMDLEGWELNALQGATRHILEDHPKLAIAVYHHASDFWRIFEYVWSLRQDYHVYLRHYTEGWSETVLFFVPK